MTDTSLYSIIAQSPPAYKTLPIYHMISGGNPSNNTHQNAGNTCPLVPGLLEFSTRDIPPHSLISNATLQKVVPGSSIFNGLLGLASQVELGRMGNDVSK